MMGNNINELIQQFEAGSVNALARLITLVENERPEALDVIQKLYPKAGNAYIVGITGPPGSGKSTLTDKITRELRRRDYTVGILAIDPTSPFSGGAVLGDRLRMSNMVEDEGIFFRSMATRGTIGGLSRTTAAVTVLLDAFGKDYILLETVGVGQDELDIVKTADSTMLISVPGLGDEIQALKAGIMEIGDIYVVNKADREGAEQLVTDLGIMRDLSASDHSWERPIIKTVAIKNEGIDQLIEKMLEHRSYLESGKGLEKRRRERIRHEITSMIETEISRLVMEMINKDDSFQSIIQEISLRKKNPFTYAMEVIEPFAAYYRKSRNRDFKGKRNRGN